MEERNGLGARVAVGLVLIVLGALLFAARYFQADPDAWARALLGSVAWDLVWPFFVIGTGTFLLGLGLVEERLGVSLVLGAMVMTVGILLLVNNSFGFWEIWTYAWTLVVPTSVGAGLWLWGLRVGSQRLRRSGRITVLAGLIVFGVLALFVEGVLGIGVLRAYGARAYILPVLLVLIGILMLVPWRRRRASVPAVTAPVGYEPPPGASPPDEQGSPRGTADGGAGSAG